jgi:putative signal transducing protein
MSSKSEHPDLVAVHTFNTRQEADLAVSALDAAGIEATIRADNGGSMQPAMSWVGVGIQVIVRQEDVAEARDILDLPAKA